MASKTYYYARVSSTSQNLARQIEAFKTDGADDYDIITEKKFGKDMNRLEYQAMKQHMLCNGDMLVVMSLDILGQNKQTIKDELEYFKNHNIRVRILDLPTSNFNPDKGQEWVLDKFRDILIEVLSSQAEQERCLIKKRQAEGIAIAKAEGKFKGRQPMKIDENKVKDLYKQYMSREITKVKMAQELGISRPTLNKLIAKLKLA